MKIALTGTKGYISSFLFSSLLDKNYDVVACNRDVLDLESVNIQKLKKFLESEAITHFILSASICEIDACKKNSDLSNRVNVIGPKTVFDLLKELKIKPIFFSTDYVFNGQISFPSEETPPQPHTLYGIQKVEIEKYLLSHFSNSVIFRFPKVFSMHKHPRNILFKLYTQLQAQQSLKLWSDAEFTFVFAEDILKALDNLFKKNLSGIFHISHNELTSYFQIGRMICSTFHFDEKLVAESKQSEMTFLEKRVTKSTLSNQKSLEQLSIKYTSLKDGLKELKNH